MWWGEKLWKAAMVSSVRAPILDPQMSSVVVPGPSVGGMRGQGASEGGRREGGGREGEGAKMAMYGSGGASNGRMMVVENRQGEVASVSAAAAAVKEDPLRYTKMEDGRVNGGLSLVSANGTLSSVKREVMEDGVGGLEKAREEVQISDGNSIPPSTSSSSHPPHIASPTPQTSHPSEGTPTVDKKEDDLNDEVSSLSSDVSDEEEMDTSSWTNSLMSFYEEPTKRTKNKRTYKLAKGILNVDGRDYPFKTGKAEFDWK